MNIYAPANVTADSKLPVKVWIHGGGFNAGAGIQYDGTSLAAMTNSIVVYVREHALSLSRLSRPLF